MIGARAIQALFMPPPPAGELDGYEEERFTGSLMMADWYQRTVRRDEADAKAKAKTKKRK